MTLIEIRNVATWNCPAIDMEVLDTQSKWRKFINKLSAENFQHPKSQFQSHKNLIQYTDFWRALPFSHGGSMTIRLKPQSESAARGEKKG